jgi:hypothetical protein
MPRKARRLQPPRSAQDQAYGQRGDQMALQRQMPLPDNRVAAQASPPGAPPTAPPPGGDPMAAVIAAARSFSPDVPALTEPSQRPTESIMAGTPIGPGPGPEALGIVRPRRESPLVQTLSMLARATGDPRLAQMRDDALRRGS